MGVGGVQLRAAFSAPVCLGRELMRGVRRPCDGGRCGRFLAPILHSAGARDPERRGCAPMNTLVPPCQISALVWRQSPAQGRFFAF